MNDAPTTPAEETDGMLPAVPGSRPLSCLSCGWDDPSQFLECGGNGYMYVNDDGKENIVEGPGPGWWCNMCGGSWTAEQEANRPPPPPPPTEEEIEQCRQLLNEWFGDLGDENSEL